MPLAQRQPTGKADILPGQRFQRGIGRLGHAPVQLRGQRPRLAAANGKIDARIAVHGPDVGKGEARGAHRPGDAHRARLQIGRQRQLSSQAGEGDIQPIARKPRAIQHQRAAQPPVHQPRIEQFRPAHHPANAGIERDQPLFAIARQAALLHHIGHHDLARHDALHGQPVIGRRIGKGAVQPGRQRRPLQCHPLAKQRGVEQAGIHIQGAETVVRQIDRAAAIHIECRAAHGEAALGHARLQRSGGGKGHFAPQRAGGQAFHQITGHSAANHAVLPRLVEQREVEEFLPAQPGLHGAVPARPAPLAAQPHIQRLLRPRHRGEEAAFGRAPVELQIEHVAIGLGMGEQAQHIAAAKLSACIHEHTAPPHIGACPQLHHAFLPQHRLGNAQIFHHQPVHPNIEIGKDRRIGIAGQQVGHGVELAVDQDQMADIESGEKPLPRPPVEVDFGYLQKNDVIRIAKLHIGEAGAPQHRSPDAARFDRKPRCRGIGSNLVEQELPARRRVQKHHRRQQQRRHCRQRTPRPNHDARAGQVAPRCGLGRGKGLLLRHQNACPSAT